MWFFLIGILIVVLAAVVVIGLFYLVGYIILWLLAIISMLFGK